jgi:choline dehydrogenase
MKPIPDRKTPSPRGDGPDGPDEFSMVHAKLQDYGVDNRRITDGSIMPTITTGNTQAPCLIIGECMAEILIP